MRNQNESNLNISTILLVDDVPSNLKLLGDILMAEGHKIRQATGGELALRAAEKEKPDLILLDIMMPGIDGYEVCRRLKANPGLADIPVIFISAMGDTSAIVKSLTMGGVDYINKPFQAEEVIARVNTQLQLHKQNLALLKLNNELQKKTKELQELNVTKDKFFSIIAHDLRGPLGGLLGLARQMANKSLKLSDDMKETMILCLSLSAQNTYDLLQNLLEWSQMVRGNTAFNLQNLILKDIITGCVNLAAESAREKSISLNIEVSNELQVSADSNMLQTVIRNLLSNSVKFTCNGGKVIVSAEPAENNMIVISVKDSGIGISDQMQAKLFSIDATTKRPGTNRELSTGLGLLLCKEFVENHGGKIWVESVEGRGSTFYFTIPFSPLSEKANDIENTVSSEQTEVQVKKLKILIVEDNEPSNLFLNRMVRKIGTEVLNALTGEQAIELCQNNPDLDLVLMDIEMPKMDGYEATQQIRQFNKDVIIIAQTACAFAGDREKALEAGCNDYITKPIHMAQLFDLIKKHCKPSEVLPV